MKSFESAGLHSAEQSEESEKLIGKLANLNKRIRKFAKELSFSALMGFAVFAGGEVAREGTVGYNKNQEIEENRKFAEAEGLTEKDRRLREIFGPYYETVLETRSHPAAKHEKLSVVDSIEAWDGVVASETVEDILDTYPQGWVKGELEGVRWIGHKGDAPGYGLGEEWSVIASCIGGRGSERSQISFYDSSRELPRRSLLYQHLPHEIAHANDWVNDREMKNTERVELLHAVNERLDSEDRFRSSYVESIENNDRQLERYLKAAEYWAEISAEYLRTPENLHYKDFMIVSQQVHGTDPDFSVVDTIQDRLDVLEK